MSQTNLTHEELEFCKDITQALGEQVVVVAVEALNGNTFRFVCQNHILVIAKQSGSFIISPTQYSVVTPKAVATGNIELYKMLNVIMANFEVKSLDFSLPIWINQDHNGEFLGVEEIEDSQELMKKEMLRMNYSAEALKEVADTVLEERLQERMVNKATSILKNPALNIVDRTGAPISSDKPAKIVTK